MASEYQLNLKAVLDSTQVQQELNKLRQSTSQALGGENARSNAQAPSGNLTNLGSTLNNLNQTLNKLNQILNRLNQPNVQSRANAPQVYSNRSQTVVPSVAVPSRWQDDPYGFGQFTNQIVRREVANAVRNAISQNASAAWTHQVVGNNPYGIFGPLIFGNGKKPGDNLGLAGTYAQQQIFADHFAGTFFKDLVQNKDLVDQQLSRIDPLGPEAKAFRASQKSTENVLFNRQMLKSMTTMLAGQALNAGANYLEMSGHTTASNWTSFGGSVASGAAMGAFVGGGAGALIGGLVGAVTGGLDLFTKSLQESAIKVKELSKVLSDVSQVESSHKQFVTRQAENRHLQAKDIGWFRSEIEKAKDEQQKINLRTFDARRAIGYEGGYEKYANNTLKLQELDVDSLEPIISKRKEIIKQYADYLSSTDALDQRISDYTEIVKQLEEEQKKLKEQIALNSKAYSDSAAAVARQNEIMNAGSKTDAEITARKEQLKSALDKAIAERHFVYEAADTSEAGMKRKAEVERSVQIAQQQYDAFSRIAEQRESSREDIQKDILAQERIKEIEALTKKYDFSKGYASDENRREMLKDFEGSRTDISGQYMQSQRNIFDFQTQMMQALKEAASEGISAEDRVSKLKEASTLDEQIQNEKNRMNVLGAAYTSLGGLKVEELQDTLSKLQAPSKDRATSLAQYGYNMGEKNDDEQRWQSELQYLKDQKQIQDDIKAILNDKLPAPATFA